MLFFKKLNVLFYQQTNWIVTLMLLVMVMDFVVKADVCAHRNIITKRTAPYMDVSVEVFHWQILP